MPLDDVNELHEAASAGSTAHTLAALSRGSIDIDEGRYTPLMIAACDGHLDVAKILLEKGASVSKRSDKGATALHGAAQAGFLAVTKLLVKAGAPLEAATFSNGSTPLHMAASRGHSKVMSVLIEAGANPNSRRLDGATPLLRAADSGHADAVKLLLRVEADPLLEAEDQSGHYFGPLEVAAGRGHSEVVRELIQYRGIEGCGGESGGKNALESAANVGIAGMLTAAGVVDTGAALIYAARLGRVAITKFLLQQPKGSTKRRRAYANARSRDGSGTTALMTAICGYSLKITRLLVDAGADTTSAVNAELENGKLVFKVTPLAVTTRLLREMNRKTRLGRGRKEEEGKLNSLKAVHRLLLQVGAVHAVSWLWPRNAASVTPVIGAVLEGSDKTQPTSTTLPAAMPILRRRTQRSRVFLAALFRNSAKP